MCLILRVPNWLSWVGFPPDINSRQQLQTGQLGGTGRNSEKHRRKKTNARRAKRPLPHAVISERSSNRTGQNQKIADCSATDTHTPISAAFPRSFLPNILEICKSGIKFLFASNGLDSAIYKYRYCRYLWIRPDADSYRVSLKIVYPTAYKLVCFWLPAGYLTLWWFCGKKSKCSFTAVWIIALPALPSLCAVVQLYVIEHLHRAVLQRQQRQQLQRLQRLQRLHNCSIRVRDLLSLSLCLSLCLSLMYFYLSPHENIRELTPNCQIAKFLKYWNFR